MKKIVAVISGILALILLTACTSTKTSIFGSSPWLDNALAEGVGNVFEESIFKVSYTQKDEENTLKISVKDDSRYKTTLENVVYNGVNCYSYKTELKINGAIDNNGTITNFNDEVVSECYFLATSDNLRPLYSKRTVKAHSVKLEDNSVYSVKYYDYTIQSTYTETDAVVTFTIGATNQDSFSIEEGAKTYENVLNGSFVDNEILFLAPRTMSLSSYNTFYTIDALSSINRKMKIAPDNALPVVTYKPNEYYHNKVNVAEITASVMNITIDSKFPGSPIVCYYSNTDKVLVKVESSSAYDLGTFTYDIYNFTSQKSS